MGDKMITCESCKCYILPSDYNIPCSFTIGVAIKPASMICLTTIIFVFFAASNGLRYNGEQVMGFYHRWHSISQTNHH